MSPTLWISHMKMQGFLTSFTSVEEAFVIYLQQCFTALNIAATETCYRLLISHINALFHNFTAYSGGHRKAHLICMNDNVHVQHCGVV